MSQSVLASLKAGTNSDSMIMLTWVVEERCGSRRLIRFCDEAFMSWRWKMPG